MKKLALAAATLGLASGVAHAGSIQRSGDLSQVLFEEGKNYLEFTATHVTGEISGVGTGPFAGLRSGNILNDFTYYSLAYKREVNEKLSFAIIGNNPVGATVTYPILPYPFAGSDAEINSIALTGLLKYQFNPNWSVYGGLRLQSLKGQVRLPPAAYALDVDADYQLGYVLGAAYEIPDIKLKIALTYDSKIEHDFRDNNGIPFNVEIPQAFTLHARTGISPTMLVFGSVRWQEWSKFAVDPQDFTFSTLPIAFGATDYWTSEVGLGKRFNENWAGALSLGYENDSGKQVGNLEGKDGFVSVGANVKYSTDDYDVTVGVKYFDLRSVNTTTINSSFSGNYIVAAGVRLGFRF